MTTHMLAEIREQPTTLRSTIDALLPTVPEAESLARDTRHVLFIGRDTSDNAAVYGGYLLQTFAGRLATLGLPSIAIAYRARVYLNGVLAVALSQSGRTGEIVDTLTWARDCGARTAVVTNSDSSQLADGTSQSH